jgi:hypothetical protein
MIVLLALPAMKSQRWQMNALLALQTRARRQKDAQRASFRCTQKVNASMP